MSRDKVERKKVEPQKGGSTVIPPKKDDKNEDPKK